MLQKHARALGAIHTFEQQLPLNDANGNAFGTLVAEVEIVETNNLRNLKRCKAYVVTCRQRITVPGCGWPFSPKTPLNKTAPYPVAVTHTISPAFPTGARVRVLDYSPKTANTAVITSNHVSQGSDSSNMQQYTSGSSVAQTNTYDVSVSLGMMGDVFSGGVSAGYSHSTTHEEDHSRTNGASQGVNAQAGAGDSMTLKDWGGYASLDPTRTIPSWSWLQEYPWSAADYSTVEGNQIFVPKTVQDRMAYVPPSGSADAALLFPPSQLSTYGIDFVSTVRWQIEIPAGAIGGADELLNLDHVVNCYYGQHGFTGSGSAAELWVGLISTGSNKVSADPLNLPQLGLHAITDFEPGNGALIGFVAGQMLYGPDATTGILRVLSEANNLYVTGSGFAPQIARDSVMTTQPVLSASTPAKLEVYFKVAAKDDDIALHLKHWRTGSQGVVLKISVNGAEPIIRHVDAKAASAGSLNLSSIELCNRDLNDMDYFDYLQLGLNHVSIEIVPSADDGGTDCGYAIRALAIG